VKNGDEGQCTFSEHQRMIDKFQEHV